MNGPWLKALRLFLVGAAGAAFVLASWLASERGNGPLTMACLAAAISAMAYLTKDIPQP